MSVSSYGPADFSRYFHNSVIFNPQTGNLALVFDVGDGSVFLQEENDKHFEIPINDFKWEHVRYPSLGYRTIADGSSVAYLCRRPGRTTAKGLRPELVMITWPKCLNTLAQFNAQIAKDMLTPRGAFQIGKLAMQQTFTSFREAALRLLNPKDKASAFALSSTFAMTLWPLKDANLALHYDGQYWPCAKSQDGVTWDWIDSGVRDIAIREGVIKA